MSTSRKPLKYLWIAEFVDGHIIKQPEDDKYSKHDDKLEHNPSAFRDILEYESELLKFTLKGATAEYSLDLRTGKFNFNGTVFRLEDEGEIKRKLIFFRNVHKEYVGSVAQEPYVADYSFGYEFKNEKDRTVKKIITIE